MNYNDQSAIVVGKGGTTLYYPAGKVQIGIRHVNRRAESMMTKAELFAQDIVLTPGFGKPRKPGIVKRLGDLSKRALDGFKFFSAMQSINVVLNSKFKSEYRAHKIAQREAKLKGNV